MKQKNESHESSARSLSRLLAEGITVLGIFGKDTIRRKRAQSFIERTLRKRESSLEVTRYHATDSLADDLANSLLSGGLFSQARLVFVDHVENIKKAQKKSLIDILERDISPHVLVLLGQPLLKSDPIDIFLRKKEASLLFEEMTGIELKKWTAKELQNFGLIPTEPTVIDSLINLSEENIDRLAALVEQLSLYLEPDAPVTPADLKALFGVHVAFREYELIEALSKRDELRYLELVRFFLAEGKSPLLLLSIIARTMRTYHHLRAAQDAKVPEATVRTQLKLKPWLFQKYREASQRFLPEELYSMHVALLQADSLLKNRSAGAEATLLTLFAHLKGS